MNIPDAYTVAGVQVDGVSVLGVFSDSVIKLNQKFTNIVAPISSNLNPNAVLFTLTDRTKVPVVKVVYKAKTTGYTVHYYKAGTNTILKPDTTVDSLYYGDKVPLAAPSISGYTVADTSANPSSVTLTLGASNTVIFYYNANPSKYTVNYYLDGTTTSVAASDLVSTVNVDDSVTVSAKDISGYTAVNTAAEPSSVTFTVTPDGSTVNFYYTQNTVIASSSVPAAATSSSQAASTVSLAASSVPTAATPSSSQTASSKTTSASSDDTTSIAGNTVPAASNPKTSDPTSWPILAGLMAIAATAGLGALMKRRKK
jgi:LPXTG-motif cell wall-anchored protein